MKPSGPGLLFAGRFLITISISVLVMGLLRFSISSNRGPRDSGKSFDLPPHCLNLDSRPVPGTELQQPAKDMGSVGWGNLVGPRD